MPCALEIIPQDDSKIQELIANIKQAKTLTMIIIYAFALVCSLTIELVQEVLLERADQPCHWPKCPKCGARIGNKGREKRQIKSVIGIIRWKRKVGTCPNGCDIGQVAPLDDELGIGPNQRVCNDLKRVACALAVFVPYEIASVLLFLATKVKVSPMAIWNWVQESGSKAKKALEAELAALQEGHLVEPEEIEEDVAQMPLIIGGDGVNVPLRPCGSSPEGKTDWREVKVGVFARLYRYINKKGKDVTRLLKRRLVAVLGNKDDFGLRMELESKKQDIENTETVVWISDGGRGFWSIFHVIFAAHAIGILDFYHAAQNLWKAAAALLDGRTKAAREWFDKARHQLRHGEIDSLLTELFEILHSCKDSMDEDSWKVVYNCYEYLNTHLEHLQYPLFKESLQLPIGSGMVESACKWLIQQRFKCVGMRWSRWGFNNLLHLRLAWVNERFDEIFNCE